MHSRRKFLAGLAAASFASTGSWAAAGAPDFLSCGAQSDGRFVLCGLKASGQVIFTIALPERGHAGAAHPFRAEAVIFARRPGRFALVIDCGDGRVLRRLDAPDDRHFYGHGTFSEDGSLLFTTENDFDRARGIIGVWNVGQNYRRIAEFETGGVGPHEMKLMPDGETLVVANGGIETHPDSGRTKLNIPTMAPNLSFLSTEGDLLSKLALPAALRRNSIRHLDVSGLGAVAFGMQWQGQDRRAVPLIGITHDQQSVVLPDPVAQKTELLAGYVGSIAFSRDDTLICATSPRGNAVMIFDANTQVLLTRYARGDVCGLAPLEQGFFLTSSDGSLYHVGLQGIEKRDTADVIWDNHIVSLKV